MTELVLDHVLIAVDDLDAAQEQLWSEHGLACAAGGRHQDMGTANRLVPLGPVYLELIVIVDESDNLPNPYFRDRIRDVLSTSGPRPFAYVLRAAANGGFDRAAQKLGLTPIVISRGRPDGSTVKYRMIDMGEALQDPTMPGIIEWEPGDNPGEIPVKHAIDPVGVVELQVNCPDGQLPGWLDLHPGLPLRAVHADPPGPGRIVIGLVDGGRLVLDEDFWSIPKP